jgi:dephospho-CoA kinase
MKIIALTGGIGSGKSTVAAILKDLGAVVVDSDKVAHEVRDTAALGEVVEAFGKDILNPEGRIDRKKLARIVFHDPQALTRLNKIVHSKLEIEINNRIRIFKQQGIETLVIEIALISEAPWVERADYIWEVKAPRETTLKRLEERGMGQSEARARMAAQKPSEDSIERTLLIIENDGSIEDLREKVVKLWNKIHNKKF